MIASRKRSLVFAFCLAVGLAIPISHSLAQEPDEEESASVESGGQDAVSKALDSTATQWSFQFAWQQTDWKTDMVGNEPRPQGLDNFLQVRVLAPLPFEKFTVLPRLTIRHYENVNNGQSGLGNSELFGLIIPKSWDWGVGRMGIGPLITFPGDEEVAKDEWGYGFAAVIVNTSGNWFYGLLLTQSWRAVDPNALPVGDTDTNPLGIAPILNFQLGGGWYIGNGDMIINYDWDSDKWYVPIGVRVGKVLPSKKSGSWNLYVEASTSAIYDNYPGAAKDSSWRFNITRTLPAGF